MDAVENDVVMAITSSSIRHHHGVHYYVTHFQHPHSLTYRYFHTIYNCFYRNLNHFIN